MQSDRIEAVLGQLAGEVRHALARLNTTHAVTAAPVALAQLPSSAAGFTGRDNELALLARQLDPAGTAGPVVVSAVAGLAGVGKTTLAVQAGTPVPCHYSHHGSELVFSAPVRLVFGTR